MISAPYTDHHVHLMSAAAARLSIDVSQAGSLDALGSIIRAAAAPDRPGWIRAWGYEEWALAEGRHPTREDLDRIEPTQPLVLHHRTGHAAAVNSPALAELGEPGHPDGVLFDRHDLLARVPRLGAADLEASVRALSREWAGAGVSAIVDCTHTNGPEELETFARWRSTEVLLQTISAMVAPAHLPSLPEFGGAVGAVRVGPVKLMPSGPLSAGRAGLAATVASAHAAGYPVAVHVVDIDVLDAVLDSFERSRPPPGTNDRIEHNSLCLPEQVGRIAACGATVVVNPAFLVHRQRKYALEVPAVERRWLVRIGSLIRAGVRVRAGSDAPVTPCRPLEIIAAAMAHPFEPAESVEREQAESLLAP